MKMKNKLRLMPILMAVAMVLSMMPLQAFAATTYKYVTVLSGEGSGNVSVYKELGTGGWMFVEEGESVEVNARLKIKATPDKYSDIDNNNVAITTSDLTGTSFQAGEKTIKTPLIFAEDENRQIIKGEFIYDPSRLSAEHDSWKNGDKGIVISFKNINTDTKSIESRKTGEGQLSCYLLDGWKMTPARRAREGDKILVSAVPKSGWTLSGLYLLEKNAAAPSAPYEITSAFSVSALNDCMYQVNMPYNNAIVYAVFTREDTPGDTPGDSPGDEPEENDTWTVTFDKNGGSGSMEAAYVDKGQEYTVPDCDFAPPEKLVFRGWNTVAEGTQDKSGTWYYPGGKVTPAEDMTLYARWKAPALGMIGIGNVWTGLDPVNAVPFTGEVDPDEEGLSDLIEIAEETWTGTDGASVISSAGPETAPVAGKTYKYSVKIAAKGENAFDPEAGFRFIYGGTEYAYDDLDVTFSRDNKTATISGFVPDKTVAAVDLKTAAVGNIVKKTYTGKGLTQSPVVKITVNGRTVTLKKGADYDVSYKNNVNVGPKATVYIKGKGRFTGTKTATFCIDPKGAGIKSLAGAKKAVTVSWNRQTAKMKTSRITGYQIQFATDSKFTENRKTVTVRGYNIAKRKVTGLSANKKYYVRIRTYKTVSKVNCWSAWSKTKTVKTN